MTQTINDMLEAMEKAFEFGKIIKEDKSNPELPCIWIDEKVGLRMAAIAMLENWPTYTGVGDDMIPVKNVTYPKDQLLKQLREIR